MVSGPSTWLSLAVRVTVPSLLVWFAGIVSVLPLSVKSPATAGFTAVAEIVTRVSTLTARSRVAVTVLTPPFSVIEGEDRVRETCGAACTRAVVVVVSVRSVPVPSV